MGEGGTTAHLQNHPKHSPGHREWALLRDLVSTGRKEFPKGPQLSTGHGARALGSEKIPPFFMGRKASSASRPSPPADVIHPSQ